MVEAAFYAPFVPEAFGEYAASLRAQVFKLGSYEPNILAVSQ